jgi:hypothetical protein
VRVSSIQHSQVILLSLISAYFIVSESAEGAEEILLHVPKLVGEAMKEEGYRSEAV